MYGYFDFLDLDFWFSKSTNPHHFALLMHLHFKDHKNPQIHCVLCLVTLSFWYIMLWLSKIHKSTSICAINVTNLRQAIDKSRMKIHKSTAFCVQLLWLFEFSFSDFQKSTNPHHFALLMHLYFKDHKNQKIYCVFRLVTSSFWVIMLLLSKIHKSKSLSMLLTLDKP